MPVGKAYDPKFQEIIRYMQDKILSGEWPPGYKVPSIAQLRKEHGWVYSTLRGALLVLKTKGLVEGKQGDGLFVTAPGGATEEDMIWLERFLGGSLRRHTETDASYIGPMSATINGKTFKSPNYAKGQSLGI